MTLTTMQLITLILMGVVSLSMGTAGYLIRPINDACNFIGTGLEITCVIGVGMAFTGAVINWMGLNDSGVKELPVRLSTNDVRREE
jgi:hypothetical protein